MNTKAASEELEMTCLGYMFRPIMLKNRIAVSYELFKLCRWVSVEDKREWVRPVPRMVKHVKNSTTTRVRDEIDGEVGREY